MVLNIRLKTTTTMGHIPSAFLTSGDLRTGFVEGGLKTTMEVIHAKVCFTLQWTF